jgi:Flp pilus assembly protein TadG
MKLQRWTTCRDLARDTRGSEIAETAMVLPLVFMLLLAIFWFGQAFRIYGTITHAAREGARSAVAPACATCTTLDPGTIAQNAVNTVNNALAAAKLDPAQVLAPTPTPNLCQCGSPSPSCSPAVQCFPSATTGSNVCVQINVQLSYVSPQGGAGACGTSVSFRYQNPYHFSLPCWPQPCTSIDLGKISLPAQAQMRVETQ